MPIPIEKQSQERRQRLLQCALTLFVEKGYTDTPVREIIMKSGYGTGTFYNYFSDKEDIFKTLLEGFAEEIISSINSYYSTEKDLYKRFVETKRITMEVFTRNEELSELYSRAAGTSEAIDQCLRQFEDKLIAFYTRNIEYGIAKGRFNDVPAEPIAHAILAVEKYLLYKWIILKAITKEQMIDMVISFHETLAQGLLKKS